MHRAVYPFKHDNIKIISFKAGSLFVVLKENENGWSLCLAQNGRIGLVPSNYIEPYEPERTEVLGFIQQASVLAPNHKPTFSVDYLPLAKSVLKQLEQVYGANQPSNDILQQSSSSTQYASSSSSSSTSLPSNPVISSSSPQTNTTANQQNNQAEQQCDISTEHSTQQNSTIEKRKKQSLSLEKQPHQIGPNVPPTPSTKDDTIPINLFWSLVTKIREVTDVNFESSKDVLKTVLTELSHVQPSWESVINSLLEQENIDIAKAIHLEHNNSNDNNCHSEGFCVNGDVDGVDDDDTAEDNILAVQINLQKLLLSSRDSTDLRELLERVAHVTEDGQQSSWALFEDLEANMQLLKQLLAILTNANESLCSALLSREQYLPCHHLVQYYQMETRIPLRRLLIQVFSHICKLGDHFINELLSMVLPLELARQLMSASSHTAVDDDTISLLGTLFSTAEALPQQHYSCFNQQFLSHVLNLIENEDQVDSQPLSANGGSQREKLIEMLMFFNQHLELSQNNSLMQALASRPSHKHLTEYLLLLFNRRESSNRASMKFLIDIFSSPSTAHIFYTNDANVLVDIIYRQVNDLSPGDEERSLYLHLLQLLLFNSDYWQHPHRQADIRERIQQISQEDPPCESDARFVSNILQQFEERVMST